MYRKLTPSELNARGLSPKSERYIDTSTDKIISKRQYQKEQRGGLTYSKYRKGVASGEIKSRAKPRAYQGKLRKTKNKKTRYYEYDNLKLEQALDVAHKRIKKGQPVIILTKMAESS